MRRVAFAVVAVLLPLSFAACGEAAEGGFSDDNGESSVIPEKSSYLKELATESGTKCVLYRDGNMGGLSCDWSSDSE